jgi:hypothetical protein
MHRLENAQQVEIELVEVQEDASAALQRVNIAYSRA